MIVFRIDLFRRWGEQLMEDQAPVFASCEELLGGGGEEGWKALESNSKDVAMSVKYFPPEKGGRSVATGKAVGVVDGSVEEVAAWAMDFCSNERMRIHKEFKKPARLELREKSRVNENTAATVKKFPFFLDNREFLFVQIWKSEEGHVSIASESVDGEVDHGVKLKKTRGFSRAIWQIEDLPLRGGAKQCRATFIQQLDAGGSIPTWVVVKKVPQQLSVVQEAIDKFRQDEEVDAAEVGELAKFIRERAQDEVYSEAENALLERIRQKFEGSLKEGKCWKPPKSPDVFVNMEATFEEGGSTAIVGRSVTIVDAVIEDCAAREYVKMIREKMSAHCDFGGLEREVVKLNSHNDIYRVVHDLGVPGFAPREWLNRSVWKVVDENTINVGYEDIEDGNFPIGAGKKYARASSIVFLKYERLPEVNDIPQTRVTYCIQVDLRGLIPMFIANSKIISQLELNDEGDIRQKLGDRRWSEKGNRQENQGGGRGAGSFGAV
ncbi:hypothetical protein TL16_g11109 [Triparma laevis f. inornata]|uniref:START domain-containing protein n=1 Tax=Triparma laevis f. inornata TaxID=1714386 RepID=A0A9W7ESI4_9STRA|nr:hypothetical protein TL16_g11109 [Triparma laevis f. inornata]